MLQNVGLRIQFLLEFTLLQERSTGVFVPQGKVTEGIWLSFLDSAVWRLGSLINRLAKGGALSSQKTHPPWENFWFPMRLLVGENGLAIFK